MAKILVIGIVPPPFNGQSVATKYLIDLLCKHFSVDFIDLKHTEKRTGKSGQFSLTKFIQIIKCSFELYNKLNKLRHDIVYFVISCTLLGHLRDMIFYFILRLFKSKLVLQVHSNRFPEMFNNSFKIFTFKLMLRHTDKVILSSPLLYNPVKKYLSESKVEIIGNTIREVLLLSEDEVSVKFKNTINRNNLNILYLSNLIKEKGYYDLLQSATIINNKSINIKITFAGPFLSDSQRNEIQNYLQDFQLTNLVSFIGSVSNYKQLLIDSDIFVLPTYYSNEAQPISMIEALNAGMAIISTNVGSIPDMLHDNKNGFVVHAQSPREIAAKIETLYHNRNLLLNMGKVSRLIFNNTYSPSQIENRYIDVISTLVK